jgi:hypothetical protein
MTRLIALAVALTLGGCGASSSNVEIPRDKAFKDMTLDQKKAVMERVVMPRAREIFGEFDAKFQDMTCKTCHGDGVADGSFKMPNPKIKPLPATEDAFMAWIAKEPDEGRWAKFMAEKVEPAMGEMLKVTVFDPRTKQGEFSCRNCHVEQQ